MRKRRVWRAVARWRTVLALAVVVGFLIPPLAWDRVQTNWVFPYTGPLLLVAVLAALLQPRLSRVRWAVTAGLAGVALYFVFLVMWFRFFYNSS